MFLGDLPRGVEITEEIAEHIKIVWDCPEIKDAFENRTNLGYFYFFFWFCFFEKNMISLFFLCLYVCVCVFVIVFFKNNCDFAKNKLTTKKTHK